MGYMAAPAHRPAWLRVDRLPGEHGIQKDTAAGRAQAGAEEIIAEAFKKSEWNVRVSLLT